MSRGQQKIHGQKQVQGCADIDAEEENTHFKGCEILNFNKRENKNLCLEKSVMTYRFIEKISIAI